ncbi:DUF4114 domain-containing protein [Roseateles sp. YR242]|uniref:DUF4114 domain-containing protein n=1 Tax=Roseateles sp. YR242 TaxID=1855305 RepID=UPI0011601DA8|nr:DUF4114 domain-containing protein [Roseateles sp. YR242]
MANAWLGHSASTLPSWGGSAVGGWGNMGWGNMGWGGHHHVHHHHGHGGHHGPSGPSGASNSNCRPVHPAPKEGQWNAGKGSYTVGQSGKVDVNVGKADADFNNEIQYRVNGGEWKTIARSKDDGSTSTIHARPGSNVEFRINTPEGNSFQAGTSANVDGIDHAKVSKTDSGFQLGFEDLRGAGGDFNDAILNLSDPDRRRP